MNTILEQAVILELLLPLQETHGGEGMTLTEASIDGGELSGPILILPLSFSDSGDTSDPQILVRYTRRTDLSAIDTGNHFAWLTCEGMTYHLESVGTDHLARTLTSEMVARIDAVAAALLRPSSIMVA